MIIKPKCGMWRGMFRHIGMSCADKVVGAAPPAGFSKTDAALVGLWYFDNNLNDSSPSGYTLTGGGEQVYVANATAPAGKQGTYKVRFPGTSNAYAYLNSTTTLRLGAAFSMGGFFYIDSANSYSFMAKHATGGNYGYKFDHEPTNRVVFNWSTNGSAWANKTTADNSHNIDTWYHLVITYDGSVLRLYTDGSETTSLNFPYTGAVSVYETSANFGIAYTLAAQQGDGYADEVFVFTDALSAAEVTQIYTYGFGSDR